MNIMEFMRDSRVELSSIEKDADANTDRTTSAVKQGQSGPFCLLNKLSIN